MKYLMVALLAVALLAGVSGLSHADPVADKSGKFTVEIASGWKQLEGEDLLNLQGPKEIAIVNVSGAAADGVTLDAFTKAYVGILKSQMKKVNVISHTTAKVDGIAAGVWVYTASVDGVTVKFKNYVAFKGDQYYNVVFGTVPERYASDVTGVDKLISTWKWL